MQKQTLKLIKEFNSQFNEMKTGNWFIKIEKALNNGRTKKSIGNIAFFTWNYNKKKIDKTFKITFLASVLLSLQDDILDNKKISLATKDNLCSNVFKLISNKRVDLNINTNDQINEVMKLWRRTIKETKTYKNNYDVWQKVAQKTCTAMIKESQRSTKPITFKKYMVTATESIGAKFLWTTYFISKKVSTKTLLSLDKAFKEGAVVARLSNDLASYYRKKNKINAVTIIANKNSQPVQHTKKLMQIHMKKLEKELCNLKLKKSEVWIKEVIQHSVLFLVDFYEHGDFDKFNWKKYG